MFLLLGLTANAQPMFIQFQPASSPGREETIATWNENQFIFSSANGMRHTDSGSSESKPANGGAYLSFGPNQHLTISNQLGHSFSLLNVNLGEYSTTLSNPKSVTFTGYRSGSSVTHTFTTDGVIDGTGPANDFQTFKFPSQFTNLNSVHVTSDLYTMDFLRLQTNAPWLSILSHPESQGVGVGGTVSFKVVAASDVPIQYQWEKNGMTLWGETRDTLTLHNVQANDMAIYYVNVSIPSTLIRSANAHLAVNVQEDMRTLWTLKPGERSYLDIGSEQRGIAYNPFNDHLILVDRIGASSANIHVMDAMTSEDLHALDNSALSTSPGFFKLSMVGVADDGVVYGANLTLENSTVHTNTIIHRWANDEMQTASTIAYGGFDDLYSQAGRLGDSMDVRGAGTNTQIILGSHYGKNKAVLFTTLDGTNFSPRVLTITNAPTGASRLGIAFASSNTFWIKDINQALRLVEFNSSNLFAGVIRTHFHSAEFQQTLSAITFDPINQLLGTLRARGTPYAARFYDVANPLIDPSHLATFYHPTTNANNFSLGSIDFGAGRSYALNSGNGILTIEAPSMKFAPVFRGRPKDAHINLGGSVVFSSVVLGNPKPNLQWKFNGQILPGRTDATLPVSAAHFAAAGQYEITAWNQWGSASATVNLQINRRPIADASATKSLIISANGTNANVVLDGSRSSDPDGDPLQFSWIHSATGFQVATNVVQIIPLSLGSHDFQLVVNDGMLGSSTPLNIQVIAATNSLDSLMAIVAAQVEKPNSYLVKLLAAQKSVGKQDFASAIDQLTSFQNHVRARISASNPLLAEQLSSLAEELIIVLRGSAASALRLALDSTGYTKLTFSGVSNETYFVEWSTNLLDWETLGVANKTADGTFSWDASEEIHPAKYYRVLSP